MKPKVNPILLSYLAGFLEGEGTITIVNQPNATMKSSLPPKCKVLVVSVGNTEMDILNIFSSIFGGYIHSFIPKSLSSSKRASKRVYTWKISARKALKAIEMLQPYLRTKRKKQLASFCIKFQRHKKHGGLKTANTDKYHKYDSKIYNKVKILNRKGVHHE